MATQQEAPPDNTGRAVITSDVLPPRNGRTSARAESRRKAARGRTLLVALGGAALLVGLDAGLMRLGVWAPVVSQRAADVHGQVMVLGFLGTLISLERAQSLGRSWAYLAPGLYGAGALALVSPAPVLLGQLLTVEAGVLFVLVYAALWRRAPQPLVAVQVLSSVLALGGSVVALLLDVPHALPWLVGFVVVVIAAERAELAALAMGPKADRQLLALTAAVTVSVLAALVVPGYGERLLGLSLLALVAWLVIHDVVRHQLSLSGQRRYVAAALLAGYANLAVAGLVMALAGIADGSGTYDVVVHGVFLGFGVSMVMAHAPVILPAVLGRPLPYRPVLWFPLVLLHAGLVVRFAGTLAGVAPLWQSGGVVTVLAMLAFLVTAALLVVRA